MVHVQNYNSPENFDRLGVVKEMQDEGVTNILQAQDGDLYSSRPNTGTGKALSPLPVQKVLKCSFLRKFCDEYQR